VPDPVTLLYKTCAALFRTVPRPVSEVITKSVYAAVAELSPERRLLVTRHLHRAAGDDLEGVALDRAIRETFKSYGHYWVESFRLARLRADELDHGFSYEGLGHVIRHVRVGEGTIMVLPHLGGWEWGAFWTARILGAEVTAVVEPIEPPELFDFFARFRESLGLHIVPLGPAAGRTVMRALRDGHVIALLADRDLEGTGVEVEFFGERTTLPAGPATIALRTGAPLIPAAIYFRDGRHHAVVRPPIPVSRAGGGFRLDVQRITQQVAHELEDLIRIAPDQWHLQQPNWPSDWDALDAIGKPHPRPGALASVGGGS
jgi:phosphatidylinositol dimannoside acyltransferase